MQQLPETSSDMQAWAWILADTARPTTDIQALMETAPGDAPVESSESMQRLREAVADCFTAMTAKDVYLLNAKTAERLSYRQLGERVGCSKSQAEREHKKAQAAIMPLLRSHPIIQERHTALRPTTWNLAAEDAVNYLRVLSVTTLPVPFDEAILRGRKVLSAGWEDSGGRLTTHLVDLGASALASLGGGADTRLEIVGLLIDRHRKYGQGNINEFKEYGLLIRMSDKVARIHNNAGDFADEATRDAYMDLVGYAAIAHMLHTDTFNLPLQEEA